MITEDTEDEKRSLNWVSVSSFAQIFWLTNAQVAHASENTNTNVVYEIGEVFEFGIQLSYLLLLLGLLGAGTFFVICQVLVRRELDLSAKELQVREPVFLHHAPYRNMLHFSIYKYYTTFLNYF